MGRTTLRPLLIRGGLSALSTCRCLCLAHYVLHSYYCISIWKKQPLEIPYLQSIGFTRGIRSRCGVQHRFEANSIRSNGLAHHPACIDAGKVHSSPSYPLDIAVMTSRSLSGCHWHGSTRVPSLKSRLVPTVAYKPNLSQLRDH